MSIKRLWRSRNNEAKEKYLNPGARWDDAVTNAKFKIEREDALDGRNSPRRRWKRATFLIGRMQDHDSVLGDEGVHVDSKNLESKELEKQHWLELVDGYLSAEQRLNYLVNIDKEGRLRWAKNNQLVDTTAGHWKDAGDGSGIIPEHHDVPTGVEPASGSLALANENDTDQRNRDAADTHYTSGKTKAKHSWSWCLWSRFTLKGTVERLLRKTVERNTWMYVSDRNFNIFVGIKETGNFQHSSFLAGGLATSAGLIKVKDGQIYNLSPLSGHYRTSVDHFRQFIHVLKERGVDMSRVHIGKEEAILRGVEHLARAKKKQAQVTKAGKETAKDVVEALNPAEWKRQVLEGRSKERSQEQGTH
ncbi:hypothetical protein CC1G_10512 [Coprinopsis cinerea okayama7|uniref:Uncharacterized protein n=1 Tax=Coprinopsis cinerea (strain Okayama-7 / 130 / ATCC MYA-4618 / FGSC 9003) TaxID=240176 RepID=A8N191_COPC7|nr:hypothetical protein CC1G_10512 [Coprinopsis cinerea okayama7\|eukprot:XP_001828640.2 hypothetical protein CC1G_10512 [Coprinopsis cinerea okayama7\